MYRFVQSICPFCSANVALSLEEKAGILTSSTSGLPGILNLGFLTRSTSCGVNDLTIYGPVPIGLASAYCDGSPLTLDQVCLGSIKTCPPRIHTIGLKGLLNVTMTVLASGALTSLTAA